MSDYLTNLAARALRTQNVVRPKLPARYERMPPGRATTNPEDSFLRNRSISLIEQESESFHDSPLSQANSVSEATVDAYLDLKVTTPAEGDVRSVPPAPSRSSDSRMRVGRSQTNLTGEESKAFETPGAPAPEQHSGEREHQKPDQKSSPPKAITPLQTVVDSAESRQRQVAAVSERVVHKDRRLKSPAIESVFQLEGFPSPEVLTAETQAAGESSNAFDQKSTREVTSIKVRPVIIASKIVDSGYSPAQEFAPQPESKAETTVNVSIGRVEVRAVQAPATHPRSAPDSVGSAITLDEYLEKRRRGGQR